MVYTTTLVIKQCESLCLRSIANGKYKQHPRKANQKKLSIFAK